MCSEFLRYNLQSAQLLSVNLIHFFAGTYLCNYRSDPDTGRLQQSRTLSPFLINAPRGNHCGCVFSLVECHVTRDVQCARLWVFASSAHAMGFAYAVVSSRSFLPTAVYSSILGPDPNLFISVAVEGHWGCLKFGALTSKAIVNILFSFNFISQSLHSILFCISSKHTA